MSDPIQRNSSARPSQHPLDDASREQCMRYLLGAMDDQETSRFENRLESEPAIGDELVAQSELICQLANHEMTLPSSPVSPVSSVSPVKSSHTAELATWVKFVSAIAACLLVGFVLWSVGADPFRQIAMRITSPQPSVDHGLSELDEELLIAQAWADGPLSLALTSGDVDADIESFDDSTSDEESLEPSEDSILNWMMVAVTAGVNHEG